MPGPAVLYAKATETEGAALPVPVCSMWECGYSEELHVDHNLIFCIGFYGRPWTMEQRKELFRR